MISVGWCDCDSFVFPKSPSSTIWPFTQMENFNKIFVWDAHYLFETLFQYRRGASQPLPCRQHRSITFSRYHRSDLWWLPKLYRFVLHKLGQIVWHLFQLQQTILLLLLPLSLLQCQTIRNVQLLSVMIGLWNSVCWENFATAEINLPHVVWSILFKFLNGWFWLLKTTLGKYSKLFWERSLWLRFGIWGWKEEADKTLVLENTACCRPVLNEDFCNSCTVLHRPATCLYNESAWNITWQLMIAVAQISHGVQ